MNARQRIVARTGGVGGVDGFTLVELLLSALITVAVAGVLFGFVVPAHRLFQSQPEQSDVQQRLRVSVDTLTRDLIAAGAGTYAGPASGPLVFVMPPVMPYRAFGDAPDQALGSFFRPDAISFVYVPSTPSQTKLAAALAAGALDARLNLPPNCPAATMTQMCGFESGDRVLIVDGRGQWDIYTVDRVGVEGVALLHRGAAAPAYDPDAAVMEVRVGSYYLKSDESNRLYQLMRHDGWATDLPVVDDVVGLDFRYFGDPEPPRLNGRPFESLPGPWTTYGPAPPPVDRIHKGWPPGENCTFVLVDGEQAPRLAMLGEAPRLVELTAALLTDGPWCPNALAPNRFDADLLRVRKVRVRVRVQAALASLRGPAGVLFLKEGTARAGDRYVPDLEARFDIAPRNLNFGR